MNPAFVTPTVLVRSPLG